MPRGIQTFFRYFPISDRDRLWGLYLTTAGESRIPPGSPYPPTGHPGGYHFDWRRGRNLREFQFVYIIAEWLYGDLAGLAPDPAFPDFKRVRIRPQPVSGVDWVRAVDSGRYAFSLPLEVHR